jgi:hypothetical protein
LRNTIQTQRISTHSYKYMYTHFILTITFEKLSRFDLEIHEVDHQKHLIIDGYVSSN